jgi:hypothetical protein
MRPRAVLLLTLAAFLASMALPAFASAQDTPGANGTSFPEPEESTQKGPLNNGPVSWVLTGIGVFAMAGAVGLFLLQRRWGNV